MKNESSSGRSRSKRYTMRVYGRRQRVRKARNVASACAVFCSIDGLGSRLHLVVIALAHLLQKVAHFVYPAALMTSRGYTLWFSAMLNLISSGVVRDRGNCSVWAPRDYKSEVRPLRGDLGRPRKNSNFSRAWDQETASM